MLRYACRKLKCWYPVNSQNSYIEALSAVVKCFLNVHLEREWAIMITGDWDRRGSRLRQCLTCCRLRLLSMTSGKRCGITFVARMSFVMPSFLCVRATWYIPGNNRKPKISWGVYVRNVVLTKIFLILARYLSGYNASYLIKAFILSVKEETWIDFKHYDKVLFNLIFNDTANVIYPNLTDLPSFSTWKSTSGKAPYMFFLQICDHSLLSIKQDISGYIAYNTWIS